MGFVTQTFLGAEAPLSARWSLLANAGVLRIPSVGTDLLDAGISAPAGFDIGSTFRARILPGLSLPMGTAGSGGLTSTRSSGSFDPTLGADIAGGKTVVAIASVQTRLPVYDGQDGVRDGLFLRTDLSGGYRLGRVVPQAGASLLQQSPDANGARDYRELSVVAGSTVHLGQRWGVDGRARVPITGEAPLAFVVRVTTVAGNATRPPGGPPPQP